MPTNSPYGLRPIKNGNGSPYCGEANLYHILQADTNAYFIGRPVTIAGGGDATGVPTVSIGVAGAPILGPIMGVHPVKPVRPSLVGTSLALEDTFIPATKSRDYYVMVCDDPDVIYEIQQNNEALAIADAGLNVNFQIVSPSQNFQFDATVIDASTAAVTATLNLKLLRLLDSEPNFDEIGTTTSFNDWEVRVNNHQFRAGTVGIA